MLSSSGALYGRGAPLAPSAHVVVEGTITLDARPFAHLAVGLGENVTVTDDRGRYRLEANRSFEGRLVLSPDWRGRCADPRAARALTRGADGDRVPAAAGAHNIDIDTRCN